ELVTGVDEEIGDAAAGRNRAVVDAGNVLERARGGGADGDNATAFRARAGDGASGRRADLVTLRFDRVVLDPFHAHRLEGPVADMQGDARDLDSTLCHRGDKRGSEVQPGGRGRDRPARVGEDGLIAIAIRRSVVALDVRGQRHVPDGVDRLVQGRSVV